MPHAKDPNWHPSQKSRRCYHRVISGIERGGILRFLTLTSSKDSPDTCQHSFRLFYMRLKRQDLIKGYIKVPEPSKNGKQHLHIIFRGKYIPQPLISQMWQDIHKAKIVDVRKVASNVDRRKLASDMASYMSKGNLYRYSWNWDWVWRGFCRDWYNLKRRWRDYNQYFGYHSFSWLLNQWRLCLVYNLRPLPICPLQPP